MKQMKKRDFENLKHGDKIYEVDEHRARGLRFVERMPNSPNYYIFSDGTHLTYNHISDKENGDFVIKGWHMGEYDSKYIGNVLLLSLKEREKSIMKVYFNK